MKRRVELLEPFIDDKPLCKPVPEDCDVHRDEVRRISNTMSLACWAILTVCFKPNEQLDGIGEEDE